MHSVSIMHRDVKLENFKFRTPSTAHGPRATLVLLDFGLQKVTAARYRYWVVPHVGFLFEVFVDFSKVSQVFRCLLTCSDFFGPLQTCLDAFGYVWTHSDALGSVWTFSEFFETV